MSQIASLRLLAAVAFGGASQSPTSDKPLEPTRGGTEAPGSSSALPRQECLAACLAVPPLVHSGTLIQRRLQAQGSGLPGGRA